MEWEESKVGCNGGMKWDFKQKMGMRFEFNLMRNGGLDFLTCFFYKFSLFCNFSYLKAIRFISTTNIYLLLEKYVFFKGLGMDFTA